MEHLHDGFVGFHRDQSRLKSLADKKNLSCVVSLNVYDVQERRVSMLKRCRNKQLLDIVIEKLESKPYDGS